MCSWCEVCEWVNWLWLYFWLAKRVVLVLETNHKDQLCKASAGVNYFGIEKQKLVQRLLFIPWDERCHWALWPCLRDTNTPDEMRCWAIAGRLSSLSSCPQVPPPSLLPHYLSSCPAAQSGCLLLLLVVWRHRGLMVSALDSGLSGPGSSLGWGHCVVFLCKTLYAHTSSLHTVGFWQI